MKKVTAILMAMMFLCTTSFAHAGLWGNFWTAVGNTVENYNADMLATGDAVNASLKEGKVLEAFTAYEQNIQVVGDHALENSKAVYKALKDIVMWLPNQIKKVWDKFVAVLQKIRDQLAAMNQPGGLTGGAPSAPSTKASSVYKASKGWMDAFDMSSYNPETNSSGNQAVSANDLGDGWVEVFENAGDFKSKLNTFIHYRGHTQTMNLYMNGLEKKHFKALDPNFTKVTNECAHIETVLLEEISESLQDDGSKVKDLAAAIGEMSEHEAKATVGSLAKKVSQRAAMLSLSGNDSIKDAVEELKSALSEKNM